MKKIAVVGAGPAGLSAAYLLAKSNIKVDVYEAGSTVGGMAKTISLWNQRVDLGPHRFFSSDPRVNKLWLEMVGSDYSMVNRLTRIYYKKTFFDYPIRPFNALKGLGAFESFRCITSYILAKIFPIKEIKTFESWVINRFGARLFGIFFKSYSEKLWGISCKELDSDFAAQRIKKLSLLEAIKSAFIGKERTKHKTLIDEFAYPHLGAGFIYERMAAEIRKNGGKIIFNTFVSSVISSQEEANPRVILEDGRTLEYDHIISTMPITLLVQKMNAPPNIIRHSQALTFRNTLLVYLQIEGENLFPDQWIYIHSSELKTGRITNFSNWVPTINMGMKDTILCLEYWCYDDEQIWEKNENQLISLAKEEIYKTNLIPFKSVKNGHVVRVPKCYPVYKSGYRSHLKPIETFLSEQKNISVIGRYGSFKYNNQDHSILMGILAAENLTRGTNHNLWELNTDYEYQESSKITATGLTSSI